MRLFIPSSHLVARGIWLRLLKFLSGYNYLSNKLYNKKPNTRGKEGHTSNSSLFIEIHLEKYFEAFWLSISTWCWSSVSFDFESKMIWLNLKNDWCWSSVLFANVEIDWKFLESRNDDWFYSRGWTTVEKWFYLVGKMPLMLIKGFNSKRNLSLFWKFLDVDQWFWVRKRLILVLSK